MLPPLGVRKCNEWETVLLTSSCSVNIISIALDYYYEQMSDALCDSKKAELFSKCSVKKMILGKCKYLIDSFQACAKKI